MSTAALQQDLLQSAEAALPDSALRAVRRAALAKFEGLPTLHDEDWRYTNLAPAATISNDWLKGIADNGYARSKPVATAALPDIDAHWLILHDGLVDTASFATLQALAADGLTVTRLADTADRIAVDGSLDRLNAALLQDGVFIGMAAGVTLDKPLVIVFNDGGSTVSQARIVIEIGNNAAIDIVEYHRSHGAAPHFANTVTQLSVAGGARAGFVRWQDRGRGHHQVGKLSARLERDATLHYASFDFGGELIRQDVFADIVGPGASVSLYGLYLADADQHIDNHTRVDHRIGPATSREEYRGILSGNARCVWNGKAIVHHGADGTDAQQANHNLLLSDKAEIDTKPELEIYADDVKCSHGATVGQLDETALFYLQSRGIAREQAGHMLTRAFVGQILPHLAHAVLRQIIATRVDTRLDELLQEDAS